MLEGNENNLHWRKHNGTFGDKDTYIFRELMYYAVSLFQQADCINEKKLLDDSFIILMLNKVFTYWNIEIFKVYVSFSENSQN